MIEAGPIHISVETLEKGCYQATCKLPGQDPLYAATRTTFAAAKDDCQKMLEIMLSILAGAGITVNIREL